ncbi:four helix bundle protein [Roseivirga sp. E12]|uniref:four helix bundle protein n=1 Tax=Roseivirga sp. E12 TaxID=2819237 RepID=UPI001ABCB2A2|nr:four helix bundle protein [Roseivirga sp. E12]MBO3697363.1 four helix bundle protein [Roseivirga sp. E12]
MKNFKKLKVWEKGMKVVEATYSLTRKLPATEKFGLMSQMNRASISIPSNIAEGSSRDSDKDYRHFLRLALGSCFELETQLLITLRLGLVESETEVIEWLLNEIDEEQKMIISFMNTLHSS